MKGGQRAEGGMRDGRREGLGGEVVRAGLPCVNAGMH
jgi:hypothetical protein